MSCQLEVLQTCVSAFMMGLINHKSMPKKLIKKCKIFDYLCKKFPLDQTQLENYSKSIAFNSTFEVERKFIQDNLLDLLIFNKCISIDSSVVQLSNSGSTTVLDSSAECMSPYLLKIKNNLLNVNSSQNQNGKGEQFLNYFPNAKSITNLQDQSCSSSGGMLFTVQNQAQGNLNSTAPAATIQFANNKPDNSAKPPMPITNQNYGISNLQSPVNNPYSLTSCVNDNQKKQPSLANLQSPMINNNPYQIPQTQHFQAMQTPTGGSKTTISNQEDIKINQFTLGSNNKAQGISSNQSTNNNNNNNSLHVNKQQANNNFYYPLTIRPINFNMTMSNNKDNTFETSIMNSTNTSISKGNNINSNNYNLNQQFNNTLYNISQQDLILKPTPTEKVNNFNPSSLLSKVRGTIATFKENSEKITTLIQSSSVTESHITPNILQSQGAAIQNYNNVNAKINNKQYYLQNPAINTNNQNGSNNGVRYQTDIKRKSYMLKNMSIYQQNNAVQKKINV